MIVAAWTWTIFYLCFISLQICAFGILNRMRCTHATKKQITCVFSGVPLRNWILSVIKQNPTHSTRRYTTLQSTSLFKIVQRPSQVFSFLFSKFENGQIEAIAFHRPLVAAFASRRWVVWQKFNFQAFVGKEPNIVINYACVKHASAAYWSKLEFDAEENLNEAIETPVYWTLACVRYFPQVDSAK